MNRLIPRVGYCSIPGFVLIGDARAISALAGLTYGLGKELLLKTAARPGEGARTVDGGAGEAARTVDEPGLLGD